jgi:hypothetical protein
MARGKVCATCSPHGSSARCANSAPTTFRTSAISSLMRASSTSSTPLAPRPEGGTAPIKLASPRAPPHHATAIQRDVKSTGTGGSGRAIAPRQCWICGPRTTQTGAVAASTRHRMRGGRGLSRGGPSARKQLDLNHFAGRRAEARARSARDEKVLGTRQTSRVICGTSY